jgi:hypothetical protein
VIEYRSATGMERDSEGTMKLFPRKRHDDAPVNDLDLRRELLEWDQTADEIDDRSFAQAIADGRAGDPEWETEERIA